VTRATRGDDALDAEARDALEARLEEVRSLRATLGEADSEGRVDDLDELAAEEERLVGRLRRDQGLGGRPRKLGDVADRVRNRVCIAIRRAIDLIGDDDPPLAAHLAKPVLTTGHTIMYRPQSGVRWSVED
jgi:hypothetical protein